MVHSNAVVIRDMDPAGINTVSGLLCSIVPALLTAPTGRNARVER
jgi:hypothetical protein